MGSFVIYILEWALSLLVLLLIWKLAFAGTTLHRFNRFYLLGATLVSALIPLAGIETEQAQALAIEGTRFATVLQQVDIEAIASDLTVNETQTVSGDHVWAWVLVAAYAMYVAVLVVGWIRSMLRMVRFLKGKSYCRIGHGIRLYRTDGDMGPFSWMNCIVISRKECGFARRVGLLHEMYHIRLGHYADLVFLLLCTILNPVCWLVLGEIRIIHEFEADDCVMDRLGIQSRDYQKLLIMRTVGAEAYALACSFESNIKQRIIMMKKEKTMRRRMLYLLAVVPAIALLLMACGSQKKVQTDRAASAQAVAGGDDVLMLAAEMPEFPGGTGALLEFLRANIRYPNEAREKNVQGRVLVSFIVEKDGSITDVHVADDMKQVIKSNPLLVDKLLVDEAVRVISKMPKWVPGNDNGQPVRVSYTVPINFRLDGSSENTSDMVIVAWNTDETGQKQVGCMLAGKNSATSEVMFVDSKDINANVKKIKKTDQGIFFLENDKDTNKQFDAVKEAFRKQKGLEVTYLKK